MYTLNNFHRDASTTEGAVTVAILDRDRHQQQSLARGVGLYGYRCVVFTDTESVLAALALPDGERIDLLIVDFNGDFAAGRRFVEQLRKVHPRLPIIVIRGLEWDENVKPLKETGVTIVQRPFTAAALAFEIERLI